VTSLDHMSQPTAINNDDLHTAPPHVLEGSGDEPSLRQADSIVDKLAAGDGVQLCRVVVAICRDERHASTRLDVSAADRTALGRMRQAHHRGAHLATGGQKPEHYAAANQAWPARRENSAHDSSPWPSPRDPDLRDLPLALLAEREQVAVDEVGVRGGEAVRQTRIIDFHRPFDQLR
jgi:hypothetical protein